MAKGGTRIGGKPKGYKTKKTLAKEAAREITRAIITRELEPMIAAQIAHAKGISYLVVRAKNGGKFIRVTEAMAKQRSQPLKDDEEIIEIWEKDPSVQAFTDLLNRALDKPAEQMKITGADDGPVEVVFRWQK